MRIYEITCFYGVRYKLRIFIVKQPFSARMNLDRVGWIYHKLAYFFYFKNQPNKTRYFAYFMK